MSQIKANDLTNVTGGIPTVKSQQLIPTAWVNFNGTGTVAIRDSEGVSSITDIATGNYSVNFTTNMANVNYAASGMTGIGHFVSNSNNGLSVGGIIIYTIDHVGGYNDRPCNYVIILGGQA